MPKTKKAARQRPAKKDGGKQSPRLPARKSARLQEKRDRYIRHLPADVSTKRINALPSPSARNTHSKECSQPCSPANKSEKGEPKRNWTQDSGQDHVRSERPTSQVLCPKQNQTPDIEDLAVPYPVEPVEKPRRPLQSESEEARIAPEDSNCHPIEFWAMHQVWPPKFAEKDANMSAQNSKKRLYPMSYTQSVREGQYPSQHTLTHESQMVKYGMVMDVLQIQTTISEESKQLCANLVSARYELPKESLFQDDAFMAVFRGAHTRNEARVARDITPMIVPSAELLHIRKTAVLEHVTEEIGTEWNQCSTIFGPRPRSDYVAGLASSAFSPDEILKLKLSHTADCPSYVTDCLYFPFLICEVKSADKTVMEAERQAMHSSSIAVRAIIRLYQKVSRAEELDRKILVLSISHDPSLVKIHGHYALIEDEKITFFRYPILSFDLTVFEGKNRWTAYHFTRRVFDYFYPRHLERIGSALSQLGQRPSAPFTSNPGIEIDTERLDNQELATSAPSSQMVGRFEKPSVPSTFQKPYLLSKSLKPSRPSTSMLQQEYDKFRDQMRISLRQEEQKQEQQRQQHQEQQEQLQKQLEEQLQKRLEEQQRQHQEQLRQRQEQLQKQQEEYLQKQ